MFLTAKVANVGKTAGMSVEFNRYMEIPADFKG